MDSSFEITIAGQVHTLSRELVNRRLTGVTPEHVLKFAVSVNGTWYPVKQVLEAAVDVPRSSFTSQTARRYLRHLGYEVRVQTPDPQDLDTDGVEWHTEANVQAALIRALHVAGWRIDSQANTATRERGVDVVASKDGQTVGVEVKGFPSTGYADPARSGEKKPTKPSTQAGNWYSQAVLAAMRLRTQQPEWRSAIALPDFPRYRNLWAETRSSLEAAQIEMWWVDESGVVMEETP